MQVFENTVCLLLFKSLMIAFSDFKVFIYIHICIYKYIFLHYTTCLRASSSAPRYSALSPQKAHIEECKFCITESTGYD